MKAIVNSISARGVQKLVAELVKKIPADSAVGLFCFCVGSDVLRDLAKDAISKDQSVSLSFCGFSFQSSPNAKNFEPSFADLDSDAIDAEPSHCY